MLNEREVKMETKAMSELWEIYNKYSFKDVMIISRENLKKELAKLIERNSSDKRTGTKG